MEAIRYLFVDCDGTVREAIADPTPGNPNDRRPPFKKKRTGTKRQLDLRKPNVGMAIEAVNDWGHMDKENSFMVGDYKTDEEFADNLGIRYVNIKDFLSE